jgi:hypothetical protein
LRPTQQQVGLRVFERGLATEDEVIAEFLRAEIDSTQQVKEWIMQCLSLHGRDRGLIDSPNLANADDNAIRKSILDYTRGYTSRIGLFHGFPLDASWRRVTLETNDLQTMRYINDDLAGRHWIRLSAGTRLIADGARNFCKEHAIPTTARDAFSRAIQPIAFIVTALRVGKQLPDLIAAETRDGSLIIIEGHKRATAYLVAKIDTVEAFIASSSSLREWRFY